MGFSDQEEKTLNSAEAPESGDTESTETTDSQLDEVEASNADLDASDEEQVEPEVSDATEPAAAETEGLDLDEETSDEDSMETESTLDEAEILDSASETSVAEQVEEELTEVSEPDLTEVVVAEPGPEIPGEEAEAALVEDEAAATDLEILEMGQEEVPAEEDDGRAWYVVHCYSGYENKVRHNLEQRIETMGMKDSIFDIVVPTEEEIEVKEGKRRTVERRVFPGYILVNMILTEESWYVVRNTPGVTGFVGMGNTPTPLRPEEVTQIIKRMEADAPRIKVTFKSGERVRIVDGPFNDFRGTVAEIDMERAKVRVMVNFFGRETPVELDFLQVERI
jgi:transcriptional antiterminator NusG